MLGKLIAIYTAVVAGNYLEAVRLVAQLLLDELKPTPVMMAANDVDACVAECEKIEACLAHPVVGADDANNPAIWVPVILAAIQVFMEWLKNRRQG